MYCVGAQAQKFEEVGHNFNGFQFYCVADWIAGIHCSLHAFMTTRSLKCVTNLFWC